MILVGYASAHGSTKGIAEEIGNRLAKAGLQAEVRSIDEVNALEAYDAVVLGSALHNMRWLPPALAFVKRHASELSRRDRDTKEMAGFRRTVRPRDHRNFAGAIQRTDWNLVGDLFLRACGGTYGDHRDWRDIDAWADGIAREMQAESCGQRLEAVEQRLS